jgi:hypothetical protein
MALEVMAEAEAEAKAAVVDSIWEIGFEHVYHSVYNS